MKNLYRKQADRTVFKSAVMVLVGLAALAISGCAERTSADGGVVINEIPLPTDLLLNLACENVGIFDEQCVLTDPENPFVNVATFEFNVNDPDAPTKFSLFEAIPQGPTGAKARFYLWATALARFPSGENQWYTARALHEVYHYNEDDIIRQQALRAYRSNLDNFFGSVTFFDVFGSSIPAPLNEIVACNIYRVGSTGWSRLVVDDQGNPANDLDVLALFGEWGYEFDAGTGDNCDGSLLTVLRF